MAEIFSNMLNSSAIYSAIWGAVSSFLLCILLVMTKKIHGPFSMDPISGIQKLHQSETPRVGGIAVFLATLIVYQSIEDAYRNLLQVILLASLPVVLAGFWEDISKNVSVISRMIASIISVVLAWWLTGYSITHIDVIGLDAILKFRIISLFFTAFAIVGVTHAINIIDGLNGLAAITSILILLGFSLIAFQVGDEKLRGVCLMLSGCIFGFLCINWPLGKIFLGDGGSYFTGFSIAWIAVMLVERNTDVSPFAALLICIFPITEVLFSIFRRYKSNNSLDQPDNKHLHSQVKIKIFSKYFHSKGIVYKNSISGLLVGALNVVPFLLAIILYNSTILCFVASVILIISYLIMYFKLSKLE